MKRAFAVTLGLTALASTSLACEPPPPTPVLTVTTTAAGSDVDPGDGVCQAASGQCTLPAAVEEGNSLGRAHIRVPADDTSYPSLPEPVSGQLRIDAVPTIDGRSIDIEGGALHVTGGAGLGVSGVALHGPVQIDGTFVADRFSSGSVHVTSSGRALIQNAVLLPDTSEGPALLNEGRAWLRYTSVYLFDDGTGLVTWGSGQTTIGATAILGDSTAVDPCRDGLPVSEGWNAVVDASCGLGQPSDLQTLSYGISLFPPAGSPLIDAVPVGTLGCGTSVTTDGRGRPDTRPLDGDHDGTAACDIGAYEALIPGA